MRSLGYPPGWLEEVCLQPSGLSLFNSDGIAETDPNDESQEREITIDINRDQYDIKKIYDFPGFNVPPPPGTIDVSHIYMIFDIYSMKIISHRKLHWVVHNIFNSLTAGEL